MTAYRVLRGGSWGSDDDYVLRSAVRGYFGPGVRYSGVGFRVVRRCMTCKGMHRTPARRLRGET